MVQAIFIEYITYITINICHKPSIKLVLIASPVHVSLQLLAHWPKPGSATAAEALFEADGLKFQAPMGVIQDSVISYRCFNGSYLLYQCLKQNHAVI